MYDLHAGLAAERTRSLLTEARYDGLARQARASSSPPRVAVLASVADRLHTAGHASLGWLRKGQLAGYPSTCQTC